MYQYDPSIHEVRSNLTLKIQLSSKYGKFGESQVPLDEVRLDAQEHFKRIEAIKQKMDADCKISPLNINSYLGLPQNV